MFDDEISCFNKTTVLLSICTYKITYQVFPISLYIIEPKSLLDLLYFATFINHNQHDHDDLANNFKLKASRECQQGMPSHTSQYSVIKVILTLQCSG